MDKLHSTLDSPLIIIPPQGNQCCVLTISFRINTFVTDVLASAARILKLERYRED